MKTLLMTGFVLLAGIVTVMNSPVNETPEPCYARGYHSWCESLENARNCDVVAYCMKKNRWEQTDILKNPDNVCEICQAMVNETIAVLKMPLGSLTPKETCTHLVYKPLISKCDNIVDSNANATRETMASLITTEEFCMEKCEG